MTEKFESFHHQKLSETFESNEFSQEDIENCKEISCDLYKIVYNQLISDLIQKQANGYTGDTNIDSKDLKSEHEEDKIINILINNYSKIKNINICIEKSKLKINENAKFSAFIDTVDGSLNWGLQMGDPCFVIAISKKPRDIRFKDLSYIFVKSLRSNDYFTLENNIAYYHNQFFKERSQINCQQKENIYEISKARACLRYGYSLAIEQFVNTVPLLLQVKDNRAIENSAFEQCCVARGVFDLMVEARNKSEHHNILTYNLLKASGAFICDLNGQDFGNKIIGSHDDVQDFIISTNKKLQEDTLKVMSKFKQEKIYYVGNSSSGKKIRIEIID